MSVEEIKRAIDPFESLHLQLKEEVESCERLKRGDFDELENLRGLGNLVIVLRITQGVSRRELARRLDVHASQVSRDERHEYFGITLERAIKIFDALNVRLRTRVEVEPEGQMAILDITPIEPQDGSRDAEELPRNGRSREVHPAFFRFGKEEGWKRKLRRDAMKLEPRKSGFDTLVLSPAERHAGLTSTR